MREFREELGKYLVIFLLLIASIGFVSGFLVADGSLLYAYQEGFEKYRIEDGNFRVSKALDRAQIREIQKEGVTLYDNYYIERSMQNNSTVRIYKNRQSLNLICVMQGELPQKKGEIAIDRMYADNNGLSVGDTLKDAKNTWQITGLVALPDYSCLFSDNNDTMFDAKQFGVAVVSDQEFESYTDRELNWNYSWRYEKKPADETAEKEQAEDLMQAVGRVAVIKNFIPQYQNQAIQFTGDDMGSDRSTITAFLYIVIVILAFVFGVTISNTISKEARTIGTLRASGYTRSELVRHYMAAPVLATLIGALVGNLLGYTVLKKVCANMYYGSYSLPTYVTIWNGNAFVLTTVVPVALMFVITWIVLRRKLSLSPLKFLRVDLSKRRQKRVFSLNIRIPFFQRFRMRVILQNMGNYVVLLIGILFANLLLMFGLAFPGVLSHYQENLKRQMICPYQYMLELPTEVLSGNSEVKSLLSMIQFSEAVKTKNPDAEKFTVYSLDTTGGNIRTEEILLYGVQTDSRYVSIPWDQTSENSVYISSAYAEKYQLEKGDTITLKEKYENDSYKFSIAGIYSYPGALSIFMPQEQLNQTFDLDKDYFSGYFSDSEIHDIPDQYIGSMVDEDALTKVSRQLTLSMGKMMYLLDGFAILIFLILIYLLSKMIIEKNAQSISMVKILGYSNREISALYIVSTTIMVILFLLLSFPLEHGAMRVIFRIVMTNSVSGWISFYIDRMIYVKMFLLGIGAYALVAALEYRRICQVPMEEALKHTE